MADESSLGDTQQRRGCRRTTAVGPPAEVLAPQREESPASNITDFTTPTQRRCTDVERIDDVVLGDLPDDAILRCVAFTNGCSSKSNLLVI